MARMRKRLKVSTDRIMKRAVAVWGRNSPMPAMRKWRALARPRGIVRRAMRPPRVRVRAALLQTLVVEGAIVNPFAVCAKNTNHASEGELIGRRARLTGKVEYRAVLLLLGFAEQHDVHFDPQRILDRDGLNPLLEV